MYENEQLSLSVSRNACLGIEAVEDGTGLVVNYDCMDNEVSLPDFPLHELQVSGLCANKQGNAKRY